MRLSVTQAEPSWETYRVRLGPVGAAHDVDLCDTGEGMAQSLPVVTALYQAAEATAQGPQTLALEQPELHLHLDAQHALADLLCEVAQQPEPPTLLIETHSEGMLVALQLAVATGKLSSDNVILHVVRSLADGSSVLDTVRLNALGEPVGPWPHDTFRQVIDDARELAAARRRARAE
jgi:predicted ATPase